MKRAIGRSTILTFLPYSAIISLARLAKIGGSMISVSMFEAKTNLSRYVDSVVTKKEPFVIISKNGKPVAKIVPYETDSEKRLGAAKGIIPDLRSVDEFIYIDVCADFSGNGGLLCCYCWIHMLLYGDLRAIMVCLIKYGA